MQKTSRLLPYLVAMVVIVVVSNILVQTQFQYFGLQEVLTWGALTYPLAFLVNDLTNRHFGSAAARKVIFAGFLIAVVLSIYFASPRIAIASGTAFLFAQLVDTGISQSKCLVGSAICLYTHRLCHRYGDVFWVGICTHVCRT